MKIILFVFYTLYKSYEHVTFMEISNKEVHRQDIIRILPNEHVKCIASGMNTVKGLMGIISAEQETKKMCIL